MNTVVDLPTAAVPLQETANDRCFACGRHNSNGLKLRFTTGARGSVSATWRTEQTWEGFPGVIHGGIVATILDEAMSKAVSTQGIRAFTCELRVRLHHHVASNERLEITGWVVEKRKRKVSTEASLVDDRRKERAHAWATFLQVQTGVTVAQTKREEL